MMTHTPSHPLPEPESLTLERASTFFKMGIAGKRQPIHDLCDRLSGSDGQLWLTAALEAGPLRGVGMARELASGSLSLAQLRVIKSRAKEMLRDGPEIQQKLAGLAGYFFTVAAGLRDHGLNLSSRDRKEIDDALLELASVTHGQFRTLLGEAAVTSHAGVDPQATPRAGAF